MASCAHQQWLRLNRDDNGFVLQYGNRLDNIANSIPRPAKQWPSLILFLGKQSKAKALRAMFPGNGVSSCRRPGLANVCVDPATVSDDHPFLIADWCPEQTLANQRDSGACHEAITHPVAWSDDDGPPTQHDVTDHIQMRLLSLFTNVLCIFAQDFGGLDQVAERLASWTATGSASSLPASTHPRLVVVTSIPGPGFRSEALCFRLRVLADPKFSGSFSSLQVVNVLGPSRAPARVHLSALGAVLREEAAAARAERVNTHTLFSMIHLAAFFDAALRDFAGLPRHTFDFIRCAREDNPVSASFQRHVASLMSLGSEKKVPGTILWEFIASAIIMDSFPPDMHRKCSPPALCVPLTRSSLQSIRSLLNLLSPTLPPQHPRFCRRPTSV
jgi:hypothetical protein